MRYLIVASHPDDEVLGAGGLIHKAERDGDKTAALIMNVEDTTRYHTNPDMLVWDLMKSGEVVGTGEMFMNSFQDSEFHREPHREMVKSIEDAIASFQPDVLITHSPADINSDHFWCSQACQEAARYAQRGRYESNPIKALYFMEVLSSTDWASNPSFVQFRPDTFVELKENDVEAKINALRCYEEVLRDPPFPRSPENIRSLACYRGSQSGFRYAEGFQTVWRRGI